MGGGHNENSARPKNILGQPGKASCFFGSPAKYQFDILLRVSVIGIREEEIGGQANIWCVFI